MVVKNSTMMPLGSKAPSFSLPDVVTGRLIVLPDYVNDRALLVMFICRHCPYVQAVKEELVRIGRDYSGKAVAIVAISANDAIGYPDDSPARLKTMALEDGFPFPFCYDETQETAIAYSAACTPDFFLFDRDLRLVYRGQLDDSRPGNQKPIDGHDLRAALDCVLAGRPVAPEQKPSIGCNIKWKPGHEPAYYL